MPTSIAIVTVAVMPQCGEASQDADGTSVPAGDEPELTTPAGKRVLRRFRVVARDWLHQIQDLEMIYRAPTPRCGDLRVR